MEIYAYFNAETLKRVFDAIVMVIGGDGWVSLLRSVAIIGLVLSVTIGLLRIQAQHSLGFLVFLAIWYYGLLLPTTTVTIVNRAGPSASPTYTVANVPIGLAFFASITSSVGDWLTTRYETMFALPNDLQFQKNGLMFGSRLVRTSIEQARLEDPGLNADFGAFMKDCVHPELFDGPVVFTGFLKSTDLVATLDGMTLNPARVASIANVAGTALEAVPCPQAWNRLKGKLAAQAAVAQDKLAQLFFPGYSNADKAAQIDASLVAADTVMLNVSRTALESVRQKMMINMVRDSNISIATAINNPTLAQTALAQAMAEQSANTAYRVMAKIGEETLPLVRNAIEVVIYAIFPIIMLLIIAAGAYGGKVLAGYALGMAWLQTWPPIFAVVHSLSLERVAATMQGLAPGGESIASATSLMSAGLGPEAIAGMLTLSIPLIAWAIVKGGEVAMSGVATGVMAPASASAQRSGDAVGVGNASAGNVSWGGTSMNSMSMNKADSNIGYSAGAASIGRGLAKDNFDMGATSGGSAPRATWIPDYGGFNANIGPVAARQQMQKVASTASSYESAASNETRAAQSFSSTAQGSFRSMYSSGDEQFRAAVQNAAYGTSDRGGFSWMSASGNSYGQSVVRSDGAKDTGTVQVGSSAGFGIKPSSGGADGAQSAGLGALLLNAATANAGADAGISKARTKMSADELAQRYASDQQYRAAVDRAAAAFVERSNGEQSSDSQRNGRQVEGALAETRQAESSYQNAKTARESAQTRLEEAKSAAATTDVNAFPFVLQAAGGQDGLVQMVVGAASSTGGAQQALGTAATANQAAMDHYAPAQGITGPDASKVAALQSSVGAATELAGVKILNGDASARAFAAAGMARANVAVDTQINPNQFASQVDVLRTAAAQGNAEAAVTLRQLEQGGYIAFERSQQRVMPKIDVAPAPTYRQMPSAPAQSAPPPPAQVRAR